MTGVSLLVNVLNWAYPCLHPLGFNYSAAVRCVIHGISINRGHPNANEPASVPCRDNQARWEVLEDCRGDADGAWASEQLRVLWCVGGRDMVEKRPGLTLPYPYVPS